MSQGKAYVSAHGSARLNKRPDSVSSTGTGGHLPRRSGVVLVTGSYRNRLWVTAAAPAVLGTAATVCRQLRNPRDHDDVSWVQLGEGDPVAP
jgi:hypothetical protein